VLIGGVRTGFFAACGRLGSLEWVAYWISAVEERGWEVNTIPSEFSKQMKAQGMAESEVFQELLAIEIETWRKMSV